jgi:O-antigen/teichoic acid export membrane protein
MPSNNWFDFLGVFKYSMALFILAIFQIVAANSRPLILGVFAKNPSEAVSLYRIIEAFPLFLISIGGSLTAILLPQSARIIELGDRKNYVKMAYDGLFKGGVLSSLLCLSVALVSKQLIVAYVGTEYVHLAFWLKVWCLTLLLSLPTASCNSLILAKGRTMEIVIISACACIVSVFLNVYLSPVLGVGSAVIGYATYVVIVVAANLLYVYPKILDLQQGRLLLSYAKSVLPGILIFLVINQIKIPNFQLFQEQRLDYFFQAICWGGGFCVGYLSVIAGFFKISRHC